MQQQAEEKAYDSKVAAFIVDHPELDAETKKELRDGSLTPAGALERMKQSPPKKESN